MASSKERSKLLTPQCKSVRGKQRANDNQGSKYVPNVHSICTCTKGNKVK